MNTTATEPTVSILDLDAQMQARERAAYEREVDASIAAADSARQYGNENIPPQIRFNTASLLSFNLWEPHRAAIISRQGGDTCLFS